MTSRHVGLPDHFALTDPKAPQTPWEQLNRLTSHDALIFRHYEQSLQERKELAIALRQECKQQGIRFLVAGDRQLALSVKADGFHLPHWLLKKGFDWRSLSQHRWLITAAAHNKAELIAAEQCGVNAALLSPVFRTESHPSATTTLGPVRFAALVNASKIPCYALGGVTRRNWKRLSGSGAAGWAAIRGL